MRIIGKTLITKGILGCKKAWSIATRGILDRCDRGQEPKLRAEDLDIHFKLTGKKLFACERELELCGCKEWIYADAYGLTAKKLVEMVAVEYLNGQKSFNIEELLKIYADKEYAESQDVVISGKKLSDLARTAIITGAISRDFTLEKKISSQKAIPSITKRRLKGGKELGYNEEILVMGRKDISPILFLLEDDD